MATIILLRHGRTSANASGVLAGWSPDVHLDELGRTQADAAAAAISACCTPERIVASPLVRCQETADALRAASGVAVETDDAVGECRYGAWTGRKLSDLAGEELWKQVQEHPSQVTFPPSPQFEHESMLAMQRRAVDAVRAWLVRARPELSAKGRAGPALFLNRRGARLSRQSAWAIITAAALLGVPLAAVLVPWAIPTAVTAKLWAFIFALSDEKRTALLAHCAARTVNALRLPWDRKPRSLQTADRLATAPRHATSTSTSSLSRARRSMCSTSTSSTGA
ncbi:histidine phosphatase family protein [Dermacoccus nishinomiyaensis]|uniref:histidine phosphatase family protein n=1 Tax=Dermacoccus nishinomiyaensis TaxID=1274 RepID=UPI00248E6444|nr:histidine phosphatase family protein [Dermacoccus nishinomiyaensis]